MTENNIPTAISLEEVMIEHGKQISRLKQIISERDRYLNQEISNRDQYIIDLEQEINKYIESINALINSKCWQFTKPLRWCGRQARRVITFFELVLCIKELPEVTQPCQSVIAYDVQTTETNNFVVVQPNEASNLNGLLAECCY